LRNGWNAWEVDWKEKSGKEGRTSQSWGFSELNLAAVRNSPEFMGAGK
jgi:hypothetical protein